MPSRGRLNREDRGVRVFDEDIVLKVRVRRMHGRIWTAGIEVLKVVPRPRRRSRRRSFERDIGPVRNIVDGGTVIAVLLAILCLAGVGV